MKKAIIVALLMCISQASISQETKISVEELATYQNNLMIKELDLNDDQQKSVKEINLKYAAKQRDLLEQDGSMFSKIGDVKKIKNNKKTELEEVLSEAQLEKYEEEIEPQIRKYMRSKMNR